MTERERETERQRERQIQTRNIDRLTDTNVDRHNRYRLRLTDTNVDRHNRLIDRLTKKPRDSKDGSKISRMI